MEAALPSFKGSCLLMDNGQLCVLYREAVEVAVLTEEGGGALQWAQPPRIQHGASDRHGGPDRPAHRQPNCAGDPGVRSHLPGMRLRLVEATLRCSVSC